MSKHCYLRPIDGNYKDNIVLEDKDPVILGRGPRTRIKNKFCARSQVMVMAMFDEHKVKVTQLGRNPCSVNGEPLPQKSETFLMHNQKLSLLQGQYNYILQFSPPPGKVVTLASEISDSDEDSSEPASKIATNDSSKILTECWKTVDGHALIFTSPNIIHCSKIAGFDLDGTLICPKSKSVFPKNNSDWKINYDEIQNQLAKLIEDGFKIVIFTNQGSLINSKAVEMFKIKIQDVVEKLGVPVEVYIAKGNTYKYRKPCVNLWELMEARNGSIKVDRAQSFYCGDAAGRMQGFFNYKGVPLRKPADHSQCDYSFAKNLGVKFLTPEEYFLLTIDERPRIFTAFNPAEINYELPLCDDGKMVTFSRQELVLMVGPPGSGKTQFAKTHLVSSGYLRVCRDELNSMELCFEQTEKHLKSGCSVVIDNTNGTKEARSHFLLIAKRLAVPCRAFILKIAKRHALHNIRFRAIMGDKHAVIGEPVINAYYKSYIPPASSEGYHEIVNINFWPLFKDKLHEKFYNHILAEK